MFIYVHDNHCCLSFSQEKLLQHCLWFMVMQAKQDVVFVIDANKCSVGCLIDNPFWSNSAQEKQNRTLGNIIDFQRQS